MPIANLLAFAVLGQTSIQTTCVTANALLHPLGGVIEAAMVGQVSKGKPRKSWYKPPKKPPYIGETDKDLRINLAKAPKASKRKAGGGFDTFTITKTTDVSSPHIHKKRHTAISNSGNGTGNTEKSINKNQ